MIFIEDHGFQKRRKGLLDVYAKGKKEDLAADEIEKLKRKVIR